MSTSNRQSALADIEALMRAHGITVDDIARAVGASTVDGRRPALVVRVLTTIGGIFVFAGIAAFVALQWDVMNSAARVIVTLGSGIALFVLFLLATVDERFRSAATPLLLGAAALEPTGILVALAEYGGGGDEQVALTVTAATMCAQLLLTFAGFRRSAVALLAILFATACWALLLDLGDIHWSIAALSAGTAWLLLGLHLRAGAHASLTPVLLFFGCWASLAGLFDLLEGSRVEMLFLAAACALIYLGVWATSRALNAASTLAILAYVAYFTAQHFADSAGWPLALIVIGLLMIGISAVALRIDRKYLRPG